MLEDETCYFLTFNFDDKKNGNDIKGDVFAFASICDKYSMPISSVNRIVQYTGRLHRKNENKKEIIVYDSVDDNFSMIRNMFLKRKKAYEKVGYEII